MKKRILTPEEESYFLDNFGKAPVQEICKRLSFSTAAYYRQAKAYGLKTKDPHENGDPIEWTPEMLETLRREFPTALNQDLGRKLGISQTTLHRKARELKLTKAPDHRERNLKTIAAKISRGQKDSQKAAANPGRFQKGERKNPAGEFKKGESWCDRASAEKVREKTQKAARTRRENTYHAMIRIKYGMQSGMKQNLRRREYIPRPDDTEAWKAVRKREAREYQMRHYLRKRGYRIDGLTAFWDETTRRSPRLEAKKGPFRFLQEPAKAPELL